MDSFKIIIFIISGVLPILFIAFSLLYIFIYKPRQKTTINYEIENIKFHVNGIREAIKPILDEYAKEQKIKHWQSFNEWKKKEHPFLYEVEVLGSDEKIVCSLCLVGEIKTNTYFDCDYPYSAIVQCEYCGHIKGKWKYDEKC